MVSKQYRALSRYRLLLLLSALVAVFLASGAIAAEKVPIATSMKTGYFNLGQVKATYPEAAGAESLRLQAEAQLRRDIDAALKKIEKAQQEKKTQEEIQKLTRDIQTELSAKKQALQQLIQSAEASAKEKIHQAAKLVAKDKGLDLVIDVSGIYACDPKVIQNGVDVTSDVMSKLQPTKSGVSPESRPDSKPAPSTVPESSSTRAAPATNNAATNTPNK